MATDHNEKLIENLAEKLDLSPDSVMVELGVVFDQIKTGLLRGEDIRIADFGTFKVIEEKTQLVTDAQGHRIIRPAKRSVKIELADDFDERIQSTKTATILLLTPEYDIFSQQIEFHFTRHGWRLEVCNEVDDAIELLGREKMYLVIVDQCTDNAEKLVKHLKLSPSLNGIPLVMLYPDEYDPVVEKNVTFLGDETLVQPFEISELIAISETELARSSEEEVLFDVQVKFRLPSAERFVEEANELAHQLIEMSAMSDSASFEILAAFREAIGNACQHGNKNSENKFIDCMYLANKLQCTFVVTDEGDGFDYRRYLDIGRRGNAVQAARQRYLEGSIGGLGIMLMLKCVDRLEYNNAGNQITLTKYIRQADEIQAATASTDEEGIEIANLQLE